tara:strand:+ start:1580 stop:1762 length:183 start_codon:yes stop_codon:yes gene_type:complete
MIEFLKLCEKYKKETEVDVTFLITYIDIKEAIDFIKNRNGQKIDIIVNEEGQDIATPIYV